MRARSPSWLVMKQSWPKRSSMILRKVAGIFRRPLSSTLAGACPMRTVSSTTCRALDAAFSAFGWAVVPLSATDVHNYPLGESSQLPGHSSQGAERPRRIRLMSRNLEEIAAEALEMSVESRSSVASRLLASLDDLAPEEYDRMWVEDAPRRYQQLKDGTAKAVASDEVFARLEARARG